MYKILKTIGIKLRIDSVTDYISCTLQFHLIFGVDNYFSSSAERETKPKYYFADNGILKLFLIFQEPRLPENLTPPHPPEEIRGRLPLPEKRYS